MQSVPVELLKAVFDQTNDGIVICDYQLPDHPILYVNHSLEAITGFSKEELVGQGCSLLEGDDCHQDGLAELKSAIALGQECSVKLRNYTKEGRLFWSKLSIRYLRDQGTITHMIGFHQDITQEEYAHCVLEKVNILFREMSKRLEYTNETDSLTKLKNRGHLSTRGEFILGAAKREKLRLHALVIDLDNFKLINKTGGNGLGDECLVKLAKIIQAYFCRATDIAIRHCSDEFVVLCIEDDDNRVLERATQLRQEVREATIKDFQGTAHKISVSIGIYSITPNKLTTVEDMIHRAGQLIFQGAHGLRDCIAHQQAEQFQTTRHM